MKKDICLVGLLLFLAACKSDDVAGVERLEHDKSDVSVNVEAGTSIYVYTDKACYAPGETVSFKVVGDVPLNARIRYRHLNEVVEEQPYNSTSWN